MMLSGERLHRLGKSDESYGKCTVLEHFGYAVIRTKIITVDPYTLPHQERIVTSFLGALDPESVQQLPGYKIEHSIKFLVEYVKISVGFDTESRQVDRCEREVTASAHNSLLRVMAVSHYSGTAPHVCDL